MAEIIPPRLIPFHTVHLNGKAKSAGDFRFLKNPWLGNNDPESTSEMKAKGLALDAASLFKMDDKENLMKKCLPLKIL